MTTMTDVKIVGERKAAMGHCRATAHALLTAVKKNKRVPRMLLNRVRVMLEDFDKLYEQEEENERKVMIAYIEATRARP